MNTSISNEPAGVRAPDDEHLGITALTSLRPQPDMQSTPGAKEAGGQNLVQNTPESRPEVLSAASKPRIVPNPNLQADMKTEAPVVAADTLLAGSAATWTVSQKLEFTLIWRAIEISLAEVSGHFGMSERHLRRLRADFGLDTRPALRRLDRAARHHLVALESFAAFTTPRGQALLKVAQERRRGQDAARDAAAAEKAARQWWRRRAPPPESADVKRLRAMQRRELRADRR